MGTQPLTLEYVVRKLSRARVQRWRKTQCGAMTRKGEPCKARPAEVGGKRCRFHGGLSTGPKSEEGRARIAAAQRKRWAVYRAKRDACADQ